MMGSIEGEDEAVMREEGKCTGREEESIDVYAILQGRSQGSWWSRASCSETSCGTGLV